MVSLPVVGWMRLRQQYEQGPWLWRPLPLVAPVLVCSDSPRMEAGRADSIKESQLENKPDLPPPSHCLLDEDVVEDLYEQDLPKGHSFTLRTRPHQGTQLFPPPHPNRGSVAARCTYLLKYYSSTWVHCPSTQVPTPLHCWSRSDLLIPSSRLCSAAWANRSTGPCHQSLSSGRKCSVQM